ncbi:MAG TPA: MFS transporter [Kofleriaceae bacterium]|nr:MFS transporter [Kofleriaceae bacterium]
MVSDGRMQRAATLAVVVAALGYFVDIYDLILFGTVRVPSLTALGYKGDALREQGIFLLNCQMGGMLVGGIAWGMLGDKRGRLSVLFGSIIVYSLANLANGFVNTIGQYAVCRLIAGIGLAGELGAGITLVSELMPKHSRGIGTTIVAAFGILGGVVAGIVGGGMPMIYEGVHWRTAFYIGGGLGLGLLVLRIGVVESGMFHAVRQQAHVSRGNFFALFTNKERFLRYLRVIAVGVPIWYAVGILVAFCNDLGAALGLPDKPRPATAFMIAYAGLAVGDLAAGLLSQWMRSRRRALAIFIAGTALTVVAYFTFGGTSLVVFYAILAVLGLFTGYWAVFATIGAEQFGTNLRATVATTSPNFVRGSVVLLTIMFEQLTKPLGLLGSAAAVGVFAIGVAVVGLVGLRETFGVDLDYLEEH